MNQKMRKINFNFGVLEGACVSALVVVAILGLTFIVLGTGLSTVGRYLAPPQMLPGLATLYFCAALTAIVTAKCGDSTVFLKRLRETIVKKVGEAEREKLRNMVLLLTFLMVAFAMIHGTTPMYQAFATNYLASLFTNLLVSAVCAVGLWAWLASFFISKQSGRNE
jgi:hypothetical protein